MKASDVRKVLGISGMTLHNYVKSGKIKIKNKFSSRKIEYDDDSVFALVNDESNEKRTFVSITRNGFRYDFDVPDEAVSEMMDILKLHIMDGK